MNSYKDILDQYFVDARHKLIDVTAFLDRLERAGGGEDYRYHALLDALKELEQDGAKRALQAFSDPTDEPIAVAPGKGASGAWPGG